MAILTVVRSSDEKPSGTPCSIRLATVACPDASFAEAMMTLDQLTATMRALYEGRHQPMGVPIADSVSFSDPVVIVQGADRVCRMFERLNRLLPASRIESFTPIDGSTRRFKLHVLYRRRPQHRGMIFSTEVEIDMMDGALVKIVEHWQAPLSLRGDRTHPISRYVRRGLGRLLT
ncbi:MAG: hypothetical protein VX589_11735 [Myxococcota bacterium]|nr:hypothetical protein [Myxococcota bacterium]